MIRHLLDDEHVDELDFGRGDDSYKQDWTGARRQRQGVLLANGWRLRGLAAIALHTAGKLQRSKA
jgi:CelD/BcsL family acetyltransferase involved in cellulose biosynthesis